PTHTESPIQMGALSNSKVGLVLSWLPVHSNTPWEMHELDPIVTGSRFRIQQLSPIQLCSPTVNFHGQWIFTSCRTRTPGAIDAPNLRRIAVRSRFGHHHCMVTDRETNI